MTYQGSKAFSPLGTKVFVEGVPMPEVRGVGVTPGKEIRLVMNWIPEGSEHPFLLDLFLNQEVVGVEYRLPRDLGEGGMKAKIYDFNIVLPADGVASLYVVFRTYDPADDGPEVEIINREKDAAFEQLIRNHFADERTREMFGRANPGLNLPPGTKFTPAGGGFTEVKPPEVEEHDGPGWA